ncbi:MAG: hypothetical protein FWF07_01205 [Methanomassiliicoccaceae archaeon]|nr:hypothetical protein [Methanomassiliicoccaceae archaeon]
MKKEDKNTLRLFQCDFNRSIEENFARMLTENETVRLFFINEDQAFTDGRVIVVDPAYGELFADKSALTRAEDYLQIEHHFSSDRWLALRLIARGQNIHESLHILYSDFPPPAIADERSSTKAREKTLALIDNVIEDAFIEAAGCSIYDNLELFLQFERITALFSNTPVEGTVSRAFGNGNNKTAEPLPINEYLNCMITFLLYPMVEEQEPSAAIAEYVERTKQLFLDGSACGEPKARHGYAQQIFDIIEPIIPENEADIDTESFKRMLQGMRTHSGEEQTINTSPKEGRAATVNRRLFTDLDMGPLPKRDFKGQAGAAVLDYKEDRKKALKVVLAQPATVTWNGTQYDCANIHKDIKIIETKPVPNLNHRLAYKNIYDKYRININSYNSRFSQLLRARILVREEKKLFGGGITSTRLADVKKRYWYRSAGDHGIPDIAIMLLIDGSGSMQGERRESAIISSLILHEVLKKQGITHAIVEHRAINDKPTVHHNILVDFMAADEEKFNILALQADNGTREGLSLYWAERYINSKTSNDVKLIIVLSDGEPAHSLEGEGFYMPPVSVKDTANAAAKIIKRGTGIIAVALDNDSQRDCYNALKVVYPSVVACTDLKRLTGQLLSIISKTLL